MLNVENFESSLDVPLLVTLSQSQVEEAVTQLDILLCDFRVSVFKTLENKIYRGGSFGLP